MEFVALYLTPAALPVTIEIAPFMHFAGIRQLLHLQVLLTGQTRPLMPKLEQNVRVLFHLTCTWAKRLQQNIDGSESPTVDLPGKLRCL